MVKITLSGGEKVVMNSVFVGFALELVDVNKHWLHLGKISIVGKKTDSKAPWVTS